LGRRRDALQIVEPSDLLERALGQELAGEMAAERRVLPPPADADEVEFETHLFGLLRLPATSPPARETACQYQVADPLRVAHRVGYREWRSARHAEQRKARQSGRSHDGLEARIPGLERNVRDAPVGEPAGAIVMADQRPAARKLGKPRTPDRALPVELEVAQPV